MEKVYISSFGGWGIDMLWLRGRCFILFLPLCFFEGMGGFEKLMLEEVEECPS